jgi:fucose 4-O-acetylase-like acetyltransferase
MSARSLQIDTLRGLACVLLVMFHTIGMDRTAGLRVPDEHGLRLFSDLFAYFRMPLFAFLSGCVYALRPLTGDLQAFMAGKVRRLLIPMLTVGTLFAVLQTHTPGANFSGYDWYLLHIQPVAHYWFLESLFLIFLLVAALEKLGCLRSAKSFLIVWIASAAAFCVEGVPIYFGFRGALYLLPFVLLGIAGQRFGRGLSDARVRTGAAALFCAIAAYAVLRRAGLPSTQSLVALGIGSCGCIFLLRTRMQIDWLARLGAYSFSIYLFHSVFSAASRILLSRAFDLSLWPLLVAGVATGLALPIAVELAIRRSGFSIGLWMIGQRPNRASTPPAGGDPAPATPL